MAVAVPDSSAKFHHPDDPRRRARQAIEAGDLEAAAVWAQLAQAEATHRLAKAVVGEADLRTVGKVA